MASTQHFPVLRTPPADHRAGQRGPRRNPGSVSFDDSMIPTGTAAAVVRESRGGPEAASTVRARSNHSSSRGANKRLVKSTQGKRRQRRRRRRQMSTKCKGADKEKRFSVAPVTLFTSEELPHSGVGHVHTQGLSGSTVRSSGHSPTLQPRNVSHLHGASPPHRDRQEAVSHPATQSLSPQRSVGASRLDTLPTHASPASPASPAVASDHHRKKMTKTTGVGASPSLVHIAGPAREAVVMVGPQRTGMGIAGLKGLHNARLSSIRPRLATLVRVSMVDVA